MLLGLSISMGMRKIISKKLVDYTNRPNRPSSGLPSAAGHREGKSYPGPAREAPSVRRTGLRHNCGSSARC